MGSEVRSEAVHDSYSVDQSGGFMALVDHRTIEPARRTPTAGDEPRAPGRGSSPTSPVRGNGVAPQKPQRPAAAERDGAPGNGLALFLGAVIGLALLKEMLGRIGSSPVTVRARSVSQSVSRSEAGFSIAVLLGTIVRIGARILGSRAIGS